MELPTILTTEQLAYVIATTVLVVKGITETLKITDGLQKRLITLFFTVYFIAAFSFPENVILELINSLIVGFGGATGMYNFLPNAQKNLQIQEDANYLKQIELEQTQENQALQLQAQDLDLYEGDDSDEVEIIDGV